MIDIPHANVNIFGLAYEIGGSISGDLMIYYN